MTNLPAVGTMVRFTESSNKLPFNLRPFINKELTVISSSSGSWGANQYNGRHIISRSFLRDQRSGYTYTLFNIDSPRWVNVEIKKDGVWSLWRSANLSNT